MKRKNKLKNCLNCNILDFRNHILVVPSEGLNLETRFVKTGVLSTGPADYPKWEVAKTTLVLLASLHRCVIDKKCSTCWPLGNN